MDRLRRDLVSTLITSCVTGIVPRQAFACAFDGIFDGSLGYVHPRSVEVALAVRKAVIDGVLAEQAFAPVVAGASGLWRASELLNQLGRRISAVSAEPRADIPSIALVLSESALWVRYVGNQRGRLSKDPLVLAERTWPSVRCKIKGGAHIPREWQQGSNRREAAAN
jgi:hypothetical protein